MSDQTKQATTGPIRPLFELHQWQPMLGLACILAGLFFNFPAMGQEQDTAYVAPSDPENEYLDAIDRIEEEYGPYASELSDLYLGLGQSLMTSGDYEDAKDAFHRGVIVKRVNLGPNSPEQTNNLYLLATIENALGELKAADELLDNILFINSNYYGNESPEMLPVLDRMYQWYTLTRPPGTLDLDYADYERIVDLTEEAADISAAAKGMSHPDTAIAYRRLADAQFQAIRHLTGSGMPMTPENYMMLTGAGYVPFGFGSDPVAKHYRAGRSAFKKYLDSMLANDSTTPMDYAEALAVLGDWCLVFERRGQSWTAYEQGYQVLAQIRGYEEQAENFMSQPRPMHFVNNSEPIYLDEVPVDLQEINLDVSMTVTSLGEIRKVEVLKAPEGMSKRNLNKIKERLRLTPFRPALKEGEVVSTKNFIWRYAIPPHEVSS